MSIRLLLVYVALPFLVIGILRKPFFGIILLTAYYSIRPDIWGAPDFLRPALIFTSASFISLLINRGQEKKIRLDMTVIVFLLLALWMLVNAQFALYSPITSQDFAIRYLKLGIQLFLVACLVTSIKRINIFFWLIVVGMLWLTKSVLAQYVFEGRVRVDPMGGMGSGGNAMATVLGMTIPFLFYKAMEGKGRERIAAVIAIPFWIFDLVAIGSRGGFLGFVLATGLFLVRSRRKLKLVALIVPVVLLLSIFGTAYFWDRMQTVQAYQQDASVSNRLASWKLALEYSKQNPLIGIGTRNFPFLSKELLGLGDWRGGLVVHNSYFELLVENGVPGLTLYLLGISVALLHLHKCRKFAKKAKDHEVLLLTNSLEIAIWVFLFRGLTGSNYFDDLFYYIIGASVGLYYYVQTLMRNLDPLPSEESHLNKESVSDLSHDVRLKKHFPKKSNDQRCEKRLFKLNCSTSVLSQKFVLKLGEGS
jgi:probable O-glycosylation ligase (exosortase A-associated)